MDVEAGRKMPSEVVLSFIELTKGSVERLMAQQEGIRGRVERNKPCEVCESVGRFRFTVTDTATGSMRK
jgi:hypothetical protein